MPMWIIFSIIRSLPSQEKVDELIGSFSADKYAADPIAPFVKSVWEKYNALSQARKPIVEKYYEGSRKYVAGLMRPKPEKGVGFGC